MTDELDAGARFGPYEVLARLGGGPLGVVYRARDTRLDRLVALKLLPVHLSSSPEARRRFMQEAKAASALDHPNICTVYEIGESDDRRVFIAMALCDGETLKARIARGPLDLSVAIDVAIQVAEGLRRAHDSGIIHRDIQPANVIVSPDGRAKILDFGLSELATVTGETRVDARRVAYQSPQMLAGHGPDRRSDVWAVGVLLYEMMTGRLPFVGESYEAVADAVTQAAPATLASVRSGISPDLERIVGRALEKRAEFRYQTVDDLLSELRALSRATSSAPPPAPWSPARVVVGSLLLAAVLGAIYLVGATRRADPRPTFTNPTQLTTAVGIEDHPAWSSDGQVVAYAASTSGGTYGGSWDIFLAQVGGGRTRQSDLRLSGRGPLSGLVAGWSANRVLVGSPRRGLLRHAGTRRTRGPGQFCDDGRK